jgi:putative oxidoreductase
MFLYGPAVLRLALGAVFAAHGAQKLFGVLGRGGLARTAEYFSSLALDRPLAAVVTAVGLDASAAALSLAVVVGVLEFVGGLLLLPGLATRWVAALLTVEMLVAAFTVHLPHGFFMNWASTPGVGHGVEMSLALIGGLVCLLFTGAGAWSIDDWRQASAEAAAAGRARRSKL